MKAAVDLNKLSEDERIDVIGAACMQGRRIGVLLESAAFEPGKIDRYIEKITTKFPQVVLLTRGPSIIANVDAVTFRLKQ